MFDQQIVERKDSSPLGTTLLVLSAACMIAASVMMGMQLRDLTVTGADGPTDSAKVWESKAVKKVDKEMKQVFPE